MTNGQRGGGKNRKAKITWLLPLAFYGCGYVGEVVPPSLQIPAQITDLRALEYGDRILVEFTVPQLTTDGVTLKRLNGVRLWIGPIIPNFNTDRWAPGANEIDVPQAQPGAGKQEIPARNWIGREVVLAARAAGPKGRLSAWSNLVVLQVEPPVPQPQDLKAEATAEGVRLSWRAPAPGFRVYRAEKDQPFSALADSNQPEYVDATAQFGTLYRYIVQGLNGKAQSEATAPVSITPVDVFPPAVPAGLAAAATANTIELTWERNTETDLQGYRVYRSVDGGPFASITDVIDAPAYSDRNVQRGPKYRYAVAAVDQAGNQSKQCAPVEASLE